MPSYWLDNEDDDDNLDKWYREAGFTASEKRTLITKWIENAYPQFYSSKYEHLWYQRFEKTRTLITAYCSNGEEIQTKSLLNYNVQPPSVTDASLGPPVRANSNEEENAPEEIIEKILKYKMKITMNNFKSKKEFNLYDLLEQELL